VAIDQWIEPLTAPRVPTVTASASSRGRRAIERHVNIPKYNSTSISAHRSESRRNDSLSIVVRRPAAKLNRLRNRG
jgi:hypothetical protein